MDIVGWIDALGKDFRYAGRRLRRSPGFTLVAILTLALGIGASIAAFTVVRAVLLSPLPFPHPEQLVRVFDDLRGSNSHDVECPRRSYGTSATDPEATKERNLQ